MRPKLYTVDKINPKAMQILLDTFELTTKYDEADVVWTALTPIKTDKLVATPCTGTNHVQAPKIIHLDETWKKSSGKEITSTAEHTFSLLLQFAKELKFQLKDKSIGIIGHGRVGNMMAKYAYAFGMNVYLTDITYKSYLNDIKEMRDNVDIISLHIPLEKNKGFLNKEFLNGFRSDLVILNTSRHEIINEDDVLEFCYCGGEYVSDFINDYSTKFADKIDTSAGYFISTPHVAGNSKEARESTDIYIARQLVKEVLK